jgi:hypothetical protein
MSVNAPFLVLMSLIGTTNLWWRLDGPRWSMVFDGHPAQKRVGGMSFFFAHPRLDNRRKALPSSIGPFA